MCVYIRPRTAETRHTQLKLDIRGFTRDCCQVDPAHIRQSRPDSGLGLQIKALKTFQVFPS